ncbi:MAG: zinc transporter substrate-binding protein [Rhodospirillales bacterium]|jgi:zinc transport system substrate-binding protein|nr:zinc transporter substrate-binding protein [Rhodospirillales bacterium]
MIVLCGRHIRAAATAFVLVLALAAPTRAEPPRVAVSIKPIHSLVASVMAGVGTPDLIVRGAASEHGYTLRPSDAKRLSEAQLVFWIGPLLENYLVQPLASLAGQATVVEIATAPGVLLLPARGGGAWEPDADDEHAVAADGNKALSSKDPHLWLDPANAIAIARVVADRLAAFDPANAPRYSANEAALEKRLLALDAQLKSRLAPLRDRRFVVFHDAYQYFDRHYGLSAIGSIMIDPEHQPGARRLHEVHEKIVATGARCVFREPQFEPALIAIVTEGTAAHSATLDPLGAELPEGPDLYQKLLEDLAGNLASCLRPSNEAR